MMVVRGLRLTMRTLNGRIDRALDSRIAFSQSKGGCGIHEEGRFPSRTGYSHAS